MATQQCTTRLQKELKALLKEPLPNIRALPSPSNLLDWHYVLEGAADSDYAGGYYHGRIIFPTHYPFKPPSIIMLTPSGRFEAGAKICLSLSDFHPESWNPMWGVSHILLGLQSFFYENTSTTGALHGISSAEKRRLAKQSLAFNVRNATFRRLFPELEEKYAEKQELERLKRAAQGNNPSTTSDDMASRDHQIHQGGVLGGGRRQLERWGDVLGVLGVLIVGVGLAAILSSSGGSSALNL